MCPDRQVLSALVDGEVPAPWNEKMLRHVESCAECSRIVREYKAISNRLAEHPEPESEAAREAVWSRLVESSKAKRPEPVWRTRFYIPLPVAMAALLAVAVLSTLVVTSHRENNALRMAVFAASELTPSSSNSTTHPATVESVLKFLETQDPRVTVTVQLPPGAGIGNYGNPVIMKASNRAPVVEEADE
jgi:anti-sigma factor RsiW